MCHSLRGPSFTPVAVAQNLSRVCNRMFLLHQHCTNMSLYNISITRAFYFLGRCSFVHFHRNCYYMTTANGSGMLNSDVIVRHLTGKNVDCRSAYCISVPLHYTKSVFRGPKKNQVRQKNNNKTNNNNNNNRSTNISKIFFKGYKIYKWMNGMIRPICANRDESCLSYQRINQGRLTTIKKWGLISLDLLSYTPGCIKLRLPINYQRVLILLI